ncbi:acyl-[acyl-carrier-protein]--UDP-N-acetylglucosamine O-acyltransferase [Saccharospirillum sp. MSK14-1]|uniref:acyl-ACP--UDP-N-acetylglucosamine O-acyltransferase n=1 Tax=Saccharospirillum sp. MSK14-1 TaxID=1897632 RepID=UPI000D3956B3|nr:acyl-ACP--UDP-N-acetylglucosamine O-acyltransferase [Saccharospirillum sp. MSK14-1]PTY37175.1 acyl-[acyl-carrier-protein]--UDP-N-acetylglucosamine O-acyltransferase [Saccharospirillum sp. MSK14-1]
MIHPTAIVDPSARLGEGVEVGPYSIIGADVEIGADTWIGPHVVVQGPTVIGRGNRIFQFASVGEACQDLKYNGEPTKLIVGDNNTIREGVTLHRGTVQDQGETRVGSNCLLMAYSHVAHDVVMGDHVIIANGTQLAGHVHVGDHAILGGNCGIHQFCHIGAHAFLGAGTTLVKDVPAYLMVQGNPAAPHGMNLEGLRRRGFSAQAISALRRAYKTVYREGRTVQDALVVLEPQAAEHPEIQPFIDSIATATRGILR